MGLQYCEDIMQLTITFRTVLFFVFLSSFPNTAMAVTNNFNKMWPPGIRQNKKKDDKSVLFLFCVIFKCHKRVHKFIRGNV